jgi:vacuolar-type H+-ATPase subunit E/Vma4
MNTEIEYLQQLETDLKDAAARETTRIEREALQGAIRRNAGRTWMRVAGVAPALRVVAPAIGFVVNADGMGGEASPATGSRDRFQEVGDATAGGGSGAEEPADAPTSGNQFGIAPGPDEALNDEPVFTENRRTSIGTVEPNQPRDLSKIIRDGRIGIVVPDGEFGNAVGDLTFIAERHGGFILSSATQNERSGTFVLRIPAKRFDRALADVRDLGTRVRFQEISGDDVTAEFIDFQARLRILQARKALLFDLFQQANTTEEILRLAGQLDEVQLRIEQIQGQLTFIRDQVAESTLRVSIQERNAPEATSQAEVDNPDLGSSFDLAVQGFLRIVGAVIVGLGYLIPLTALGAVVWMAVWFVRRRRALS